ncbi:hypothetical protein LINPERHAP1_LOCUS26116, partial [Linum perenne]
QNVLNLHAQIFTIVGVLPRGVSRSVHDQILCVFFIGVLPSFGVLRKVITTN